MANYKRIVVIGYGVIVPQVLDYLVNLHDSDQLSITCIEHELVGFSNLEVLCKERGIDYYRLIRKKDVTEFFLGIEEKTIIISVSNNYLFPKSVVSKKNYKIINFHNALLPSYPGRNAPSWVIFCGEHKTGITWHYVTEYVDAGRIIAQKETIIGADTKAFELAYTLMKIAFEAFVVFFPAILDDTENTIPQALNPDRRIYKSTEVPGGGSFSLNDPPEYIYRLLRSIDYGRMELFPKAETEIDGKRVEIVKYRTVSRQEKNPKSFENCSIRIRLDNNNDLLLKYQDLVV